MVAKQGRVRSLLLLLPCLRGALADEPQQRCEAEVCEDPDGGSLLSLKSALKGRKLQEEDNFPTVSCLPPGVTKAPTNSRSDGFCAGNQCCSEYSWGYPCPNSEASWRAQQPCSLAAIELPRNSSTYLIPFGQNWANTPQRFRPGNTPQEVLDASKPKVPPFEVLSPQSNSFISAFKPAAVWNQFYYKERSYPSIWGDVGEVLQPGFGGLKTYSVLKVQATPAEPLTLYRMTTWQEDPKKISQMCNIWWGLESTYKNSFFEVSRNIATCSVYSAIVQCNVSSEAVVLVGQGQVLKLDGFKERKCATATGNFTTSFAQQLAAAGFPPPDESTLQFVLPACQQTVASCKACPLPAGAALMSETDIVSHVTHPKDPSRCVHDLLGGSDLTEAEEDESRPFDFASDHR